MSFQRMAFEHLNMPPLAVGYRFMIYYGSEGEKEPVTRCLYFAAQVGSSNKQVADGLRELADMIESGKGLVIPNPIQ